MKNIKLTISYDGSRYNGWQRLGDTDNTIQEKIETTLGRILDQEIEVFGSGRTDAGVHALAQVANFHVDESKLERFIPDLPDFIMSEANRYLPKDIRITSCEKAHDRFHARLNSKVKTYEYRIDNGPVARVFDRRYLTRIEEPIDMDKLRKAAEYFVGEHDFLAFCANKHFKKSSVRNIYSIDVREEDGIIYIRFKGSGFLRNMVRIIVGTMVDCACGRFDMETIPHVFETKDRANAAPTAPPEGLFLIGVEY
ncbi:MAG: tRNA pseudouridine(38-40) synthase TruA [Lachnospiraceae bacterium]|nr:tRNA pseudouridine(38-40) synthase TruA [Lachnospiraceae bacterium]